MLTVHDIAHSYVSRKGKRVDALRGVSFDVAPGAITALVGPNGSGKSTLFRLITGTLKLQQGSVRLAGAPLHGARLGVVFQSPSLDQHLTVFENIRHHAMLYGKRLQRGDDADGLYEALDLQSMLDRRVSELSGGFQRRVELAKALLTDPEVLVLDEPFTGLDVQARETFFRILSTVTEQRGLVTLLITHVLTTATQCAHIVVLEQGTVIADDSPTTLLADFGSNVIEIAGPGSLDHAERFHALAGVSYIRLAEEHVLLKDATLQQLLSYLDEESAVSLDIQMRRPTLDDYFVARTGHHLQSDAEELIAA